MLKTALFTGSNSLPVSADDFLGLLASCKGNRTSLIKYDANLKVRAFDARCVIVCVDFLETSTCLLMN